MDQPEPKNFWTVTALKTLNSGLQQVSTEGILSQTLSPFNFKANLLQINIKGVADYDIDNIFQATLNTELQGFLVELNNLFL